MRVAKSISASSLQSASSNENNNNSDQDDEDNNHSSKAAAAVSSKRVDHSKAALSALSITGSGNITKKPNVAVTSAISAPPASEGTSDDVEDNVDVDNDDDDDLGGTTNNNDIVGDDGDGGDNDEDMDMGDFDEQEGLDDGFAARRHATNTNVLRSSLTDSDDDSVRSSSLKPISKPISFPTAQQSGPPSVQGLALTGLSINRVGSSSIPAAIAPANVGTNPTTSAIASSAKSARQGPPTNGAAKPGAAAIPIKVFTVDF